MKRKLILIMLAVISAVALAVGLTACVKDDQGEGESVNQGSSHRPAISGECENGHEWNDGEITTAPTCITPGVVTYTCLKCGTERKEVLDADGSHVWSYNDDCTRRTCRLCGYEEAHEHDFGDPSKDDDVNTLFECECGESKTVGEIFSFKVTFDFGDGATVIVSDTQNIENGYQSDVAYARDSVTGELLNDGEGQVNFKVVAGLGYRVVSVTASPAENYKNLKDPAETGAENTYRLTKITGAVTISVETEIIALSLPVLVINTENYSPIVSKEDYLSCTVTVSNADEAYCFSEATAQIRGRGNTTWDMPKKPYRLKFTSKTDLFGNGKAKNWTLIANYGDQSMVRNYLAFILGASLDSISETTTTVQFVELYLNGSYEGVYLVCEQIETGSNRVDIEDDFTNALNPDDMGYLIELDGRAPEEGIEGLDYFVVDGINYAIKSPDYEGIEEGQDIDYNLYFDYIKNYFETIYNLLCARADYSEVIQYMDADSFADTYIVHELFNMCDVIYSSVYFYKRENGKLYSGPIWDFDISSGNCDYNWSANPEELYAKENVWYSMLLEYDEFKDLVSQKLASYTHIPDLLRNSADELYGYTDSFLRNFERWDILGKYVWPNSDEVAAIDTWQGHVEYVIDWLTRSLDFMLSVYCSTNE